MKLVIEQLGKVILAVIAVALVLTLVITVVVPAVGNFVGMIFPNETNYVDKSDGASALTLSCAEETVYVAVGETVDLDKQIELAGITALSGKNENLIPQLTEDYEKPYFDRSHVFVYQTDDKGTSASLKPQIDTVAKGNWTVIYMVDDGVENASIKVSFIVR